MKSITFACDRCGKCYNALAMNLTAQDVTIIATQGPPRCGLCFGETRVEISGILTQLDSAGNVL